MIAKRLAILLMKAGNSWELGHRQRNFALAILGSAAQRLKIVMGIAAVAGHLSAGAQEPMITLEQNGQLTWTNRVNTNAIYRVEWASRPGGPWHTFTYQPIHTIDANSNRSFTVEVPIFYRVVMMTNPLPVEMVWIDGGEFVMGDTQGLGSSDELPVHTNFISGFWMDEMEVTKAKWDEVYMWATNHGYTFDTAGAGKTNVHNHPVQSVNWYDCVKWCNARSQMEGLTSCYYTNGALSFVYKQGQVDILNDWVNWSANGYRLPTEAEWEKAARGGRQGRLFPWGGDTISHSQANYRSTNSYFYDISPTRGYHPAYTNDGRPYTSPVGSFAANGYGLHDMAGNVGEWCWDWYGNYVGVYQTDPRGPAAGSYRVLRGGNWDNRAVLLRCADRYGFGSPGFDDYYYGFRCVRGR